MAKVNRNMNSHNTDTGNPHAVYDFHWHNLEFGVHVKWMHIKS